MTKSKVFLLMFLVFIVTSVFVRGDTLTTKIHCSNPELTELTQKIIQKNSPRYVEFFNIKQPLNIEIFIAGSSKDIKKHFGENTPKWVVGATNYRDNIIKLKSPKLSHISYKQYENTVKHEMVHFLQNSVVPLTITPDWFDEGVAEYLSDGLGVTNQVLLSNSLRNNKLIKLEKLNSNLLTNRTKSELAYTESASLIDFLVIAFGENSVQQILQKIRNGLTFSEAWEEITGMEYDNLSYHWKRYLEKRYKWIFMLDFKYLIWLIMPVLLIIGFIIKKITNAKIVSKWENEDVRESIKIITTIPEGKTYPHCQLYPDANHSITRTGDTAGDESSQ